MNHKYTNEEKQAIITRYSSGNESVAEIVTDTGIPRSTIYNWIKQNQKVKSSKSTDFTVKDYRRLENRVKRLELIIEIIKKAGCSPSDPLEIKLPILESLHNQYNVHIICEALDVPRGTFYNYIYRGKHTHTWYAERREKFKLRIQEIYNDNHQIFGAAKICAIMKEEGYRISAEMVRELMRDMGLTSIRQDAKDLYDKEKPLFPNRLNQQFNVDAPNQVWVSDVTYFRYNNVGYYICVIIDLYARTVVAHKISQKNSTQLTKATFKMAYEKRKPSPNLMFHSDRGGNYIATAFREYLESLHVTQSFSRSGVPYDNSVMETFFSSMKREELYRTKYRSENEFKAAVDKYILFYNEQRPHAKNAYKTPAKKEADFFNTQAGLQ